MNGQYTQVRIQLEAFLASLAQGQHFTLADVESAGISPGGANTILNKWCSGNQSRHAILTKVQRAGAGGAVAKWAKK